MFDEPRPEINMRPGESLIYWECKDCVRNARMDPASRLEIYGADRGGLTMDKQARVQMHIVQYVKMMRDRGDEPMSRV